MKSLFGQHIEVTGKVLDLRLKRQNYVMGNLANVNTPGYRPRTFEFEDSLQKALNLSHEGTMTRTRSDHLPSTFDAKDFRGVTDKDLDVRVIYGDDQVDVDKEMTVMAKNSMLYNALTGVIKKSFQGIEKAIQDGKSS